RFHPYRRSAAADRRQPRPARGPCAVGQGQPRRVRPRRCGDWPGTLNAMSAAKTRRYIVATDVGGTCTDTIVFAEGEPVHIGKALSTPPNFGDGVIASVRNCVEGMGIGLEQLFAETRIFVHGSTVVDNTVLTRDGAVTGLVTTAGFEDTLSVTRGAYGRWAGLPEDEIKHPVATERAAPLVPDERICGVPERIDYKGAVVRDIDDAATEKAL